MVEAHAHDPIERRRRLQTDEGFLRSDRIQKLFVEPFRLVFEKPRFNVDSCLPKLRESASIDDIVWIGRSDHDALDARLDDRVRARSGAAVVHARLERNVHRRVARIIALEERLDLRMRLTRALMPPLGNDLAVADNDASNHRIRADRVAAALRELERAAHEAFIVHGRHPDPELSEGEGSHTRNCTALEILHLESDRGVDDIE